LQYIKNISGPENSHVEILLINNNSTDNSEKIIQESLRHFTKIPWKLLFESKLGVTQARLRGIYEAQYNYIVFCDDDNLLFADYLQKSIPVIKNNINFGALGGYGIAKSSVIIPEWFSNVQNYYGVGPQMPQSGKVHKIRNVIYGAGMILNKEAFMNIEQKGFSFFSVSRIGAGLGSGEDSELCLALRIGGYDIYYNTEMLFYHVISPHRLNKKYLSKLQFGIASSGYVTQFYRRYLFGYRPHVTKYFWLKEFLYSVKDLVKGVFVNPTKSGFKRNVDFSLYLLRERGRYNENVKKVLGICDGLSDRVSK
jgi:glycosyltransferase involved in cell wall biosynthesis